MQDQMPAALDERRKWVWFKALKWVLHITYRLFNRCGTTAQGQLLLTSQLPPKHKAWPGHAALVLKWLTALLCCAVLRVLAVCACVRCCALARYGEPRLCQPGPDQQFGQLFEVRPSCGGSSSVGPSCRGMHAGVRHAPAAKVQHAEAPLGCKYASATAAGCPRSAQCPPVRAPPLPQAHVASQFLEDQLAVLHPLASGRYLSPRVTNLCLQYLTRALELKGSYKQLKPHIEPLLGQVVLPLLCFDEEDAELWEEDPQEFVRKVGGWQHTRDQGWAARERTHGTGPRACIRAHCCVAPCRADAGSARQRASSASNCDCDACCARPRSALPRARCLRARRCAARAMTC